MNEKKFVTLIVVGAVLVCGLLTFAIIYRSRAKAAARDREVAALARTITATVARSDDLIKRRDFEQATQALQGLAPNVSALGEPALNEQLRQAMYAVAEAERDYKAKIKKGYVDFEGRLIPPEENARLLAERENREKEEKRRRVEEEQRRAAEAKARAAEEARRWGEAQESARLATEKQRAQEMLADAIQTLPSLKAQLDEKCASHWILWYTWALTLSIAELQGKANPDTVKYETSKADLIKLLNTLDSDSSPVLVAYRDEIVTLLESLGFSRYVRNREKREVPISFALYEERPVLLIASVLSDTVYNNVNQALNTPKKRAANFVQREIFPTLMHSKLSQTLNAAKLEYFGLVFIYGNRNFIRKEDNATPESLALIMSTRDYVAFVKGEMTQEAFLRNSLVFLAHGGAFDFVKVELKLE